MKRHSLWALLALASIATGANAAAPQPATDWKENVAAGETEQFTAIGKEINALQDKTAADNETPVTRAFHAKAHTVLQAEFKVSDAIPAEYRIGLFAKPATYKAWVRMSNGQIKANADRSPDVRGLAMKVMDVPGQPLTPGASTFDILTINHPVQPARNIHQFMSLVRAAGNTATLPFKLGLAVGPIEAARIIAWTLKNLGGHVPSMATSEFWSCLPSALGKYAVRYKFEPRNPAAADPRSGDENYLRDELTERLKKGDVKWDLMVQFYTDEKHTPIEDAAVDWNTPFMKVGELTVSHRDLSSAAAQAEEAQGSKMLFHPWHAPTEHRPLGNLMRARRIVYPASGGHRGSQLP